MSGYSDFRSSEWYDFHRGIIKCPAALRLFAVSSGGAISKKRETKEFLNTLIASIGEDQLIKLYNDLDRKMDEKGNLFLRLSKEKALDEEWEILDGGDSIHLKIKIAAYPAKKEVALKKIKEIFPEDIVNA